MGVLEKELNCNCRVWDHLGDTNLSLSVQGEKLQLGRNKKNVR